MKNKLLALFESRRFWVAVAGVAVLVVPLLHLECPPELLLAMMVQYYLIKPWDRLD